MCMCVCVCVDNLSSASVQIVRNIWSDGDIIIIINIYREHKRINCSDLVKIQVR